MKKILTSFVVFPVALMLSAQESNVPVITITGTKFPFTIMQQWIDAYSKIHPEVRFELSKAIPLDSAELMIAAHAFNPGELKNDEAIVAVNRYAQLPIVNSYRPGLKDLQQKGFTQTDMGNIYFNPNAGNTAGDSFTVYKRDKNVCATRSFTENVTGTQEDMKGKFVTGDDRALSAAVKNDVNGISYNNLGLVYNIQTRKIADSISIVPIDLNGNGVIDKEENNYATLDAVLDLINATHTNKIPQENVNIVFKKNSISKTALSFLQWIITEGQQYNRTYGFMDLDKNIAADEQAFLATVALNKNSAAVPLSKLPK
ncbi:MAG TPA: hypothetical protein PLP23_21140 [Panacibacter sp.]|nr:hypothetical protein [Panacibacter sp.]